MPRRQRFSHRARVEVNLDSHQSTPPPSSCFSLDPTPLYDDERPPPPSPYDYMESERDDDPSAVPYYGSAAVAGVSGNGQVHSDAVPDDDSPGLVDCDEDRDDDDDDSRGSEVVAMSESSGFRSDSDVEASYHDLPIEW